MVMNGKSYNALKGNCDVNVLEVEKGESYNVLEGKCTIS